MQFCAGGERGKANVFIYGVSVMSMIKCYDCDMVVDSKSGDGEWIEVGNMRRQTEDVFICEWCVETRKDDEEFMAEAESHAMDDAEKQEKENAKD